MRLSDSSIEVTDHPRIIFFDVPKRFSHKAISIDYRRARKELRPFTHGRVWANLDIAVRQIIYEVISTDHTSREDYPELIIDMAWLLDHCDSASQFILEIEEMLDPTMEGKRNTIYLCRHRYFRCIKARPTPAIDRLHSYQFALIVFR